MCNRLIYFNAMTYKSAEFIPSNAYGLNFKVSCLLKIPSAYLKMLDCLKTFRIRVPISRMIIFS